MGRYLIIDNEDKAVEQITEALKAIDGQPIIESFANYAAFETHVAGLNADDLQKFWAFHLMIIDYASHTPNVWPEKIAKLKATNTIDFSVVLTSYENNFTANKFIRPLDIYNFIFKPFDALILKESLNLATKIKKRAQPIEMKSQSATAFIALLKEVELQTISELGFVTISDSQIDSGSVSKYFSAMFAHGKKQSCWAQCLVSIPHPQKPGSFINKFQFYAAEQPFLNTVRKYIVAHKADHASSALWNLNPPKAITQLKMAVIGLETDENKAMVNDLEGRYTNLKVELLKIEGQKKADQALYDHDIVLNTTDIKFETLGPMFKPECIHLWFTQIAPKEDDLKLHAAEYRDIYIKPLDRSYFYKKMKIHLPALNEKDLSHLLNVGSREVMKVANKVKISEISELYVNLVYQRELPYKDFREFVFLGEDETQVVELPAFCHYTEKSQNSEEGGFLHQFVFFAMTDHFLKQIRLWLLHNYIVSNKKD